MRKGFIRLTAVFTMLFILAFAVNLYSKNGFWLSSTITFGVFSYHFLMRLFVGLTINKIFDNNISYNKKWFRTSLWEEKFYKLIRVKKWKRHIPTFAPETFSLENTYSQIASATCQAELVHEIIVILSFLPILLSIWFSGGLIFLITSIVAAGIDMIFVILQRYNRPRILKIITKRNKL